MYKPLPSNIITFDCRYYEGPIYELKCPNCDCVFTTDFSQDINISYNKELDEFIPQCPMCKMTGFYTPKR